MGEKIIKGWNLENSYIHLPKTFYKKEKPEIVPNPKLVILNEDLAATLGLNAQDLKSKKGIEILSGNRLPTNSIPIAQAYAGHQFGHFTMLGDGRAVLLGEQISPDGKRLDIQLKGSGRTAYSRGGDGKAALGPMLREYIISEAMYNLDIPTTRSLAVVTTGEKIARQGRPAGAVLTRVASSYIRVGTFQYAAAFGTEDELRMLAEYTIQRHFPHIASESNRFLLLIREVAKKQARLIAKWQLVGFIHGVMNTDNMAISGETIDYGPCAFMDRFNENTVFSSIDRYGRYSYGNQPAIAAWNLERFAETLLPLIEEEKEKASQLIQEEIKAFIKEYKNHWLAGMRAKLGLFDEEAEDQQLIRQLLTIMEKYKADFTNSFRALTINEFKGEKLFTTEEFASWHSKWRARLDKEHQTKEERAKLMQKANPALIPRNHRVEEALKAAEAGNLSLLNRLLEVLKTPYKHQQVEEEYTKLPPPNSPPYRTFCGT